MTLQRKVFRHSLWRQWHGPGGEVSIDAGYFHNFVKMMAFLGNILEMQVAGQKQSVGVFKNICTLVVRLMERG